MKLLLLLFVGAILALYGASQYLARQVASQYPPKGRFADVGDVRLHYTDYAADGDADLLPLVFIHGASGNLREQEGIILDQLKGRGRLIFLDRPGHGYSSRGSANDMHLPAGQARIVSGLLSAIGVEKAILVGDLNIAPREDDVWNHKQLLKIVSHTPIEVEHLAQTQEAGRWVDITRQDLPEGLLYSWWSYRAKDWDAADKGRRLDHIWATPDIAAAGHSSRILRAARGWEQPSDHAPVFASFDL